MGADAAKTNNDDEGGAEGREAGVVKKDVVAGELFEDQLVIIVASSGSGSDLGTPGVLFACQRGRSGGTIFSELRIGVVSPIELHKACRSGSIAMTYILRMVLVTQRRNRSLQVFCHNSSSKGERPEYDACC
jgi:hypothetical protein